MKRFILAIALMATGIHAEIKRCPFEQELVKIYAECVSNEETKRKLLGWQTAWGFWLAEVKAQYPDAAKMSRADSNYAARIARMYLESMMPSELNDTGITITRFPLEKMLTHLYVNSIGYKLTAANINKISDEYKKWVATDLFVNELWSLANARYFARISTMLFDLVFLTQPA